MARDRTEPAILSPVSRLLAVADIARSTAFYRDVLGFDARAIPQQAGEAAAEAVRGPARLQLFAADSAHDSTGQRRPRGAAVVFFETDDVVGMHAAAHGARRPAERPGEVQRDQDARVPGP